MRKRTIKGAIEQQIELKDRESRSDRRGVDQAEVGGTGGENYPGNRGQRPGPLAQVGQPSGEILRPIAGTITTKNDP